MNMVSRTVYLVTMVMTLSNQLVTTVTRFYIYFVTMANISYAFLVTMLMNSTLSLIQI